MVYTRGFGTRKKKRFVISAQKGADIHNFFINSISIAGAAKLAEKHSKDSLDEMYDWEIYAIRELN